MERTTMNIPVIALRGLTVFPDLTLSFDVEREISIYALDSAMESDERAIFLVTQREISTTAPTEKDLYSVGTICRILQILKTSETSVRVIVEGRQRARIHRLWQNKPFLQANVELLEEDFPGRMTPRMEALIRQTYVIFGEYKDLVTNLNDDFVSAVLDCRDPGRLADFIAQNINLRHGDRQRILEELNPSKRLRLLNEILAHEVEVISLEVEMEQKVRSRVAQVQKDMILREQLKVLQHELGDDGDEEIAEYTEKIEKLKLPEEIHKKLMKEVDRLAKQPYGSAEASVIRNYLDVCLDMPWHKTTKDRADVAKARAILDKEHFGLEKVKERILEFIAVQQINPDAKGKILCLVGPPGVGKTSISYSIARSLNRKMARISLGGIHDEADIRGHRKTYVGAMPGRIMTAMTQAGSCNPVLLLDEIDKLGSDYRGDPSAALLEVLDAEQNHDYRDHYLEIPFDLSDVLFITTANTLDTVPRPLLDRMEIIELGSYTDEEKFMIAKNHLIPKQLKKHGLKKSQLRITDDAIRETISCYTRESGVRNLERCFGEICRKTDMEILSQETPKKINVTGSNLETYLGVRKFLPDRLPCTDQVGLVTGLAWTSVGGETLEVEVNVMDGSGKLELTGNLGDVMKESAHAALSYIRANAQKLGVAPDFYKTKDIHVHFPEGAVPKDGPSAGVTVCTAIVSALTGVSVRRDIAMTGEISLRGRVMRIGGLREKTMAALRHGVRTVIIPKDNERDLEEIDQTVRRQLNFISAQTMDTVLSAALNRPAEVSPAILTELPGDVRTRVQKPGLRQ